MAVKKSKGSKTEKPPAVDKLILPAIGIGLALLAFQFFKGVQSEVRTVVALWGSSWSVFS